MIGSSAFIGAALGLGFGAGLVLILWCATARPRLIDRVAPYLRDRPATSRLLQRTATRTPFPTVERLLRPVLADLVRGVARISSPTANVQRRLTRAGQSMTVEHFRIEQVIWAVLGLTGGLALALLLGATRGSPLPVLVGLVVLAGVAGAVARDQQLTRQAVRRERRIVAEFPAVAELFALAVGAGESPIGALERLTRTTQGQLTRELELTLADVRSGRSLEDALDAMSARTDLASLARFADGVATAVDRGTPLADVLRSQAQDSREVARRALMEEGGRREIVMMIPVVFVILPISILFAIFPGLAVLRIG